MAQRARLSTIADGSTVGIVRAGSHMPVLLRVLRELQPHTVLEVGAGWYSTPLLQAYSLSRGREHCILETNAEYGDAVSKLYGCHIQLFDGVTVPDNVKRPWGLVFIDHVQDGRRIMALAMKDRAAVIVLHDSQPKHDRAYRYSTIIPKWKYHRQFTDVYPHTLMLTDSDEVWQVLGA